MGAYIQAFIQIDDNTPSEQPAFTNAPSTWDLRGDIGLSGCKDYAFFGAISGIRNESGVEPWFARRGLPDTNNRFDPTYSLAEETDDSFVSWLTLTEIRKSIEHMALGYDQLSSHVVTVIECLSTIERQYGTDRVRFVFAISD